MIYLDCAATSMQKPAAVERSMARAMKSMASPGRGGHSAAMRAADTVLNCRDEIAGLFNLPDSEGVVFTLNATHALNIAIGSLVHRGDRVVISGYEHNSVTRPLHAIGADVVVAASPLFDADAAVEAFAREIPAADVVVCTHVSNVFGFILPIGRIAELCSNAGVPLIIDASQSAGAVKLDISRLGAAYVAMPGHKSLLGPQGTGILLCGQPGAVPIMYGGTGSNSAMQDMPDFYPDRLEAGTHNVTGIAGLLAGVRYVKSVGEDMILQHEKRLMRNMAEQLSGIDRLHIFADESSDTQSGVLSVVSEGITCEDFSELLGARGVAVRSGLHCSPTAHTTAGTFGTGTVRFSFSPFNTREQIFSAVRIIKDILK